MSLQIDINFYFPDDAQGGDPDRTSPTLKRYHQLLWSKPLPDGRDFDLDDTTIGAYLHHKSDVVGEFFLSSDSVIHTFRDWKRTKAVIRRIPANEIEYFHRLACSIGAKLIFPGNKIDGKITINGARGFSRLICDRLDLTLECIRRHYLGEQSPLSRVLHRYQDFFALFQNFQGYAEFFLLQDLVEVEDQAVNFFTDDFDDFSSMPVPQDVTSYRTYMERSIAFVKARNARIQEWELAQADEPSPGPD